LNLKKIAAYLFEKNKRYPEAIEICKEHELYKQAIDIASESGSSEVAGQLLEFFIEIDSKTCFAACLFTCYDLIKPDEVLFLAWKHQYIEFVMPYLSQILREYTDKVDKLIEEKESFGSFNQEMDQPIPNPNGGMPMMNNPQPPGVMPNFGFSYI